MGERRTREWLMSKLDELVKLAEAVCEDLDQKTARLRFEAEHRGGGFRPTDIGGESFIELRLRSVNLVSLLEAALPHLVSTREELQQLKGYAASAKVVLGTLRALRADVEAGVVESLVRRTEDLVVADYLAMAEEIMVGEPGAVRHVAAAAVAGAVLEDALRRLCGRQNPPVSVTRPDGSHKKLVVLIDDLKAAGVYNELRAKQLRAWADIRNAADHGWFDKFGEQDVVQMLAGISAFLADHL